MKHTLTLLTVLLLAPLAVSQAAETKRPNILIVINDDQSWLECSAYGNSSVQTPAFDRVAKAGVLFTRAYCSAPSCATGAGGAAHGPELLGIGAGRLHPGLAAGEVRHAAGTTGSGRIPCRLHRQRLGARREGAHRQTRRSGGQGLEQRPHQVPARGVLEHRLHGKLPAVPRREAESGTLLLLGGHHRAAWTVGADNHKELGMGLDKVKLPGFVPDTPGVRRERANYLYEVQHADRTLGALLKLLEDRGELANTLVIVTADNGTSLPRAKTNLYDWGVHVPLAMMWPARAPAGRMVSDFVGFPDLAPTILEAAGLPVPPEMSGRSVLKTLLSTSSGRVNPARDVTVNGIEWHGNLPPIDIAARMIRDDRFAYIVNYSSTPRYATSERGHQPDDRYAANAEKLDTLPLLAAHPDRPELQRFIQLIKAPRPREELYDCVADPDQLHNLADKPEFVEVMAELRSRLEAYQRQTHDPRITGDMAIFAETQRFVEGRKAAGYNDTEANKAKATKKGSKTK